MDLEQLLEASEQQEEKLFWEGTFADYLHMATEQVALARLSHARIYDMIMANGTETGPHGEKIYGLFKDRIFGQEQPLDRIVQYFASAAKRFEVRKRILLLLGPPASGKSSIVNLIKRGLEKHTREDEGSLYAIKGCPMQEEPLHLIPAEMRSTLEQEIGLYIEGDLCPRCGYMLRNEYDGKISKVMIRRVTLNERESAGIGTFVSSDPGSQNLSLLVGSIDNTQLGLDRVEAAGRAYRLDGELNVANRGIMEFAEFFKTDEPLLRVLLGLAQEQEIKMGRFGSVYADESIIAHSNEGDFKEFVTNPKTEALLDRIITVKVPYNLRISEEKLIYGKMLQDISEQSSDTHLSPLAIPLMATFAVLSRLDPPEKQGMSLTEKLRLYDGQHVVSHSLEDVAEMKEEHPDEGMTGISPRYVMNKLSNVVTEKTDGCVCALPALNTLWESLGEHITLVTSDRVRYAVLLQEAIKLYDHMARADVRRAYVENFEKDAARKFDLYWASLRADHENSMMVDPETGVETHPDEKAMSRVEERISITDRNKAKFRDEIYETLVKLELLSQKPDFTTHPELREGIEQTLLPGPKDLERVLFRVGRKEVEQERQKAAMQQRLVQKYGYCNECSRELLDYVAFSLRGGQAVKINRSNKVRWQWALS
jgi:serine protein kinase